MDETTFTVDTEVDFSNAIKWAKWALENNVSSEVIAKKLSVLYTDNAEFEYGTRRHQMTIVAVVVAVSAIARVAELEAKLKGTKKGDRLKTSGKPLASVKKALKRKATTVKKTKW